MSWKVKVLLALSLFLGAVAAIGVECTTASGCDYGAATTFSLVQPQYVQEFAQPVYAQQFVQPVRVQEVRYFRQPIVQQQIVVRQQRQRVYSQPFVQRQVVRERVIVQPQRSFRQRSSVRIGY